MTALLEARAAVGGRIEPGRCMNDGTLQPADYRTAPPQMSAWMNQLRDSDVLWTRSSQLGAAGQNGTPSGQGGIIQADCQRWEWNFPPTGCHVRKVVSGVVLNASSVPIAGATVNLYNTATGLLVDTQTSQADGTYTCGDPNATNCFAVAYLAGSPDTAGTTLNTITGT